MRLDLTGAETKRTAIIITAHLELLERLVEEAGYEIVGVADVAVNGERLAVHFLPDVIVVENELMGEQGWDALPHLAAASPASQILLVVAEDWTPSDLRSIGAFAVVTRVHLERLVSELADLDLWIEAQTAKAATAVDHRSGRDRRDHQDWSAVGFEKRQSEDRRLPMS